MIFNSQGGGAAQVEGFVSQDTITPGDEAVTIPGKTYLLGDMVIDKVPTTPLTVTPKAAAQSFSSGYYKPVTVAGDSNLIPENIAEGVNIFGVLGTHVGGAEGIDFGIVTVSSESQYVTVNHKLDAVPSYVALIPIDFESISGTTHCNLNGTVFRALSSSASSVTNEVTDKTIKFAAYSSSYGFGARDYYWIAIK